MKLIGKKILIPFSLLLIPYCFILYICIARTDGQAILPGGLTDVSSFVEIEGSNDERGSFNSVYVTTFYPTTIFQDYILNGSVTNTVVDNSSENHLSNKELTLMNTISHDASVAYSLITAYNKASESDNTIHLDYEYQGFTIYYYKKGLDFKVGDKIIAIDGISYKDVTQYKEAYLNQFIGTKFTILREDSIFELELTEKYFPKQGYIYYQTYQMFNINYETSYPRINVSPSGTGGPSGGLLQTLSVFNRLTSFDYSLGLKIAGTGTINLDGSVGSIGGIEQKIYTAYDNNVDIFFCPKENYEDALSAYNQLKNKEKMELVVVETFYEAISYLKNHG